jgi:hypothetical protein
VVELDFLHLEKPAPFRLIPRQSSSARLASASVMKSLCRFRIVKLGECIQAHRVKPIRLAMAEQAFQRFDADVSVAVSKFGKR